VRTRWLWLLVVGFLVLSGVNALSAKPLLMAQGEFWTELHFAGQWLDVQIAFNVQDRGEDGRDHGSMSARAFDHRSGKLAAVMVATDVWGVQALADGITFTADVRVVTGSFPGSGPVGFRAYDRETGDEFYLLHLLMPVYRGHIVIR
jgi:hypothetical protein